MKLGSWASKHYLKLTGIQPKFIGLYLFLFGVPELHSHIRARVFIPLFKKYSSKRNIEIGAGSAYMSVIFSQATHRPITACCYSNDELVKTKNDIKFAGLSQSISIIKADARNLNKLREKYYDCVLLLDVLEHIEGNDKDVLSGINKIMVENGNLIISVPTPMYKKHFGKRFDEHGWPPLPSSFNSYVKTSGQSSHHLRHYTIPRLTTLLDQTGFKVVESFYYTNKLASILVKIWYDYFYNMFWLRIISFPLLDLLARFDSFSRGNIESCSTLVVAKKI